MAIVPGTLEWQRLQLSDGTFARLVTTTSAGRWAIELIVFRTA